MIGRLCEPQSPAPHYLNNTRLKPPEARRHSERRHYGQPKSVPDTRGYPGGNFGVGPKTPIILTGTSPTQRLLDPRTRVPTPQQPLPNSRPANARHYPHAYKHRRIGDPAHNGQSAETPDTQPTPHPIIQTVPPIPTRRNTGLDEAIDETGVEWDVGDLDVGDQIAVQLRILLHHQFPDLSPRLLEFR